MIRPVKTQEDAWAASCEIWTREPCVKRWSVKGRSCRVWGFVLYVAACVRETVHLYKKMQTSAILNKHTCQSLSRNGLRLVPITRPLAIIRGISWCVVLKFLYEALLQGNSYSPEFLLYLNWQKISLQLLILQCILGLTWYHSLVLYCSAYCW